MSSEREQELMAQIAPLITEIMRERGDTADPFVQSWAIAVSLSSVELMQNAHERIAYIWPDETSLFTVTGLFAVATRDCSEGWGE